MTSDRRKICVVTGTRAEYGLLRWLLQGIQNSDLLDLQLIATGMHLSPEFGLTVQEVLADGFTIDLNLEMLLSSDTPVGITKSMGLAMIGFADAFAQLKPDLLLVLGDRFEIMAAATSALMAQIPIAHLHGGETTQGVVDESIRHAITKMASLHFVAAEEYRKRVIQLGEEPGLVYNVGGLGVDSISRLNLLSKEEVEHSLGIQFLKRSLLVTFHPSTLDANPSPQYISQLLAALDELEETSLIFTMPNADIYGRSIAQEITSFCKNRSHAHFYASLGQLQYLSCVRCVDGVVGNSSSGILEVPTLGKGTVNIGDRQLGRLRASSVIDCDPNLPSIRLALCKLFSKEFQESLARVQNPYGTGGASDKILDVLQSHNWDSLVKKKFYDINVPL
jgi:GDP/UDP-N,N'-diacetylbacillosamine 2-epimerase (hydrolysing)